MYEIIKKSSTKKSSSKYDFIKVRIWLNDNKSYILSRFIVTRILTSIGIKKTDSVRIGLRVKKYFVDNSKFDISQKEFEENLFIQTKLFGYGKKKVERYKMMNQFHQKRVPMLILFFGSGCVGKSTVSSKISELMNISSVLQTGLIYELHKTISQKEEDDNISYRSEWLTKHPTDEILIEKYKKQCEIVKDLVFGDIKKCFVDGKSIIIEGTDLDPSLYNDIVQKYRISSKDFNQKGIIVPFYMKNDNGYELYIEQYYLRNKPDIPIKDLTHNFKVIRKYLESVDVKYKLEVIDVDLLSLRKKTCKLIQRHILKAVENVSALFNES